MKYRYFCHIFIKLEFFYKFSKIIQISNFTRIRPARTESFHADGQGARQTEGQTHRQTDRNYEFNGRFSQFCELLNNKANK